MNLRLPFLPLAIVAAVMLPLAAADATASEDGPSQPNILFIITDDLNDAISGLGGHPQARTPQLDRLRQHGISFTNAHANSPLCAPSRGSFLSGYHPHTSGYYSPRIPGVGRSHWQDNAFLRRSRTIMEHFTAEGYLVLGTGKVFHNHHEDWTDWFDAEGRSRFGHAPSWGPWPWDGARPNAGWGGAVTHPGETASLGIDGNFASLADTPVVPANADTGAPGFTGWRLYRQPFRYHSDHDRELLPDELNARWTREQLRQDFTQPFLMIVGLNRPHSPLYAPQEYFDRFPLDEIQLFPAKSGDINDTARLVRTEAAEWSTGLHGFNRYEQIMAAGGEDLLCKWTQAYLANVAFVDDVVGDILAGLEESSHADNTLVIFTSDHGYHMGDKGIVFKNTLWDKATRVPLIFAGPGIDAGRESKRPVSLLDLFPTMNDLAGISNDPNAQTHGLPLEGTSLRALFKASTEDRWKGPDHVITSIGVNRLDPETQQPLGAATSHFAVRSQDFRYIRYNNGEEELYHCAADPYEWHNVADRPEFAAEKERLRALLPTFE